MNAKARPRLYLTAAATLLATAAIAFYLGTFNSKQPQPLAVHLAEPPTSIDPLDFDMADNMPLQSMLNTKLFTNYRDAGISGEIASRWSSQDAFKVWKIQIRKDITFSDESLVTARDVAHSLRRIFFLMKSRKSKNEILSSFSGLDKLSSAAAPDFSGISYTDDEVVFRFKKPVPKLIEALGFGLYSIVHSSSFDPQTGKWLVAIDKGYIGAGPYLISELIGGELVLKKRFGYPKDLTHISSFPTVRFASGIEAQKFSDLSTGLSDAALQHHPRKFLGAGEVNIYYFACYSWKKVGSPCNDLNRRRQVRDGLDQQLRSDKFNPTTSFFPFLLDGVKDPTRKNLEQRKSSPRKMKITFRDNRNPIKPAIVNGAQNALVVALEKSGFEVVPNPKMSFSDQIKNRDPDLRIFTVDIGFISTSIVPYDPMGDIRFMFSQEGIGLPDANGSIHKELALEHFSVQKINQELYDQAIVWPVFHASYGIWAHPRLDLSRYNQLLPLGELQWIGQK